MIEQWRNQRFLGQLLLLAFVVSVLLLWALTPVNGGLPERLLGNIALSREEGLDAGFGAFPELVKDQGGSRPVPLEGDAPLRSPEYRGVAWLGQQDARAYTLQVAVFSDERSVGNLLGARGDREQFTYFQVPDVPDPALQDESSEPVHMRYVVTYGSFPSREQAEEVAAALRGLPGRALPRQWGGYQAAHAALPPPTPVSVRPPAPESSSEPVQAAVPPVSAPRP